MKNYFSVLSHAAVAGTGFYCLGRCIYLKPQLKLSIVTLSIVIPRSIIGVLRWSNYLSEEDGEILYTLTHGIQTLFILPCITGYMWFNSGNYLERAYLHPIYSLIPFSAYFVAKFGHYLVDLNLICAINVISCAAVSFYSRNYFGMGIATIFAINRYWNVTKYRVIEIPTQDIYNIAFCVFMYYAYKY